MNETFTIACSNCGKIREVWPRKDGFVKVIYEPCSRGDSFQEFFNCEKCEHKQVYYWDQDHSKFYERDEKSDLHLANT
jgi:hypothetical protein